VIEVDLKKDNSRKVWTIPTRKSHFVRTIENLNGFHFVLV